MTSGEMERRQAHYMLLSRLFTDQVVGKDIEEFVGYLDSLATSGERQAAEFADKLKKRLESPDLDHLLKTEYARLFIMPGGVRPYESVYRGKEPLLMQEPWVQVKQFYQKCGLKLENPGQHPEDHVSVELSFMLHLIETGDPAVEREFFNQHIISWVPKMLEDISGHRYGDFYSDVARFGQEFLAAEAASMKNHSSTIQGSEKHDEE